MDASRLNRHFNQTGMKTNDSFLPSRFLSKDAIQLSLHACIFVSLAHYTVRMNDSRQAVKTYQARVFRIRTFVYSVFATDCQSGGRSLAFSSML